MEGTGLIMFLIIGAVAGWLAGKLMKGGGFGLVGNIVVGVIGAFIGGYLFGALGIAAGGLIGSSPTMENVRSMIAKVATNETTLETIETVVLLIARCASITSLLRRLINSPDLVCVKNRIDMRCKWA